MQKMNLSVGIHSDPDTYTNNGSIFRTGSTVKSLLFYFNHEFICCILDMYTMYILERRPPCLEDVIKKILIFLRENLHTILCSLCTI